MVVLDEAALRRIVGSREVMHAQVERLIEASKLPNVTLGLLPFTAGAHAGVDGEFTIFSYDEQEDPEVIYEDPDIVYVDNIGGGAYIEDPMMTYWYNRAFERLVKTAWGPPRSAEFLAALEEELRKPKRG